MVILILLSSRTLRWRSARESTNWRRARSAKHIHHGDDPLRQQVIEQETPVRLVVILAHAIGLDLVVTELADAFHWWARSIEMEHELAEWKRLHRREKQLKTGVSAAQEEVQRVQVLCDRQVQAVREEMKKALARQAKIN